MSDEQDPRESTEVKRIRDSDTNPYMGLHSPETTPCVEDVYCSIADEDVVLPSKRLYDVTITQRHGGWSRGQCAIVWTLTILLIASLAFGIYFFLSPKFSCRSDQKEDVLSVNITRDGEGCLDLGAGEIAEIPPRCCSFPFTYKGNLLYQCTPGANGHYGCFMTGRIWTACAEPHAYRVENITIHVSIPHVVRYTATSVNGWIVFQQRLNETVNFNYAWLNYRDGFGKHDENFWIGLEKLYQLTNINQYRLRFELELYDGTWLSAEYNNFTIGDEETKYKIQVDGYSGETGDLFNASRSDEVHNGMPFSTWDNDNDGRDGNYAALYRGGWWYNSYAWVNLNGMNTLLNSTYNIYGFFFTLDEGEIIYTMPLLTSRMMMKLI